MKETPPLLFLKTGVICAEPAGFYEAVAWEYGCEIIGIDQKRLAYCEERGFTPTFSTNETRAAKHSALRAINEDLGNGKSIFFDSFLNSRRNREELYEISRRHGTSVVLLAMRNSLSAVHAAIEDRYEEDSLTIPSAFTEVSKLHRIAVTMQQQTEWPQDDEPHCDLDGFFSSAHLLEEVADYVDSLEATEEAIHTSSVEAAPEHVQHP